jgi:hypothetical protein
MYIGTSLGGCLRSLMTDEVSEDNVMFIVTRTNCPTFEDYIKVVEAYHAQGNPHSRDPEQYELDSYPLEEVVKLAERLWHSGKIHQPRVYADTDYSYRHPARLDGLWMQVVPTNQNTNLAVVDAYEKYKMLDMLTK